MHLQDQASPPSVKAPHELPVEMVTDVETSTSVPVLQKQAPLSAPLPAPPQPTAPAKKKKKRKNGTSSSPKTGSSPGSPDPLDESSPLPNEESIRGDGVDQWRARAQNRRALLVKAGADNKLVTADLNAALARVSDAEHAEATVNKGLLTARSVISQRDRALADLTTSHTALKADHAKLVDEKRRADKRLVILKTVSANLQEAREARDLAERKLEDANGANASLVKEVASLKKQVEALNMLKQQLSRAELEIDELAQSTEKQRVDSKRASVRAAGLGAAGALALSVTLRALARHK